MKAIEVVKSIEKRFGKEAIAGKKLDVAFIPTGSLALDVALGGGVARGRLIEFTGWESSGKTTGALHVAAEVQRMGKKVAYVDVEQAMDLFYAEAIGVNVDIEADDPMFYLSQPDCAEDAIEIVREFAKSEEIGLIVLDSIAALVPKAVIQGEAGDAKMAIVARIMSQMLPTLVAPARKSGVVILFINQYREKIGQIYGDSKTTPGGNAMKFYASQRVEWIRFGSEKEDEEIVSNKTRCKVLKNKVAPPFRIAEFLIKFGVGIDKTNELLQMAVDYSIINKSGSWYNYGTTKLGQGMANVSSLLEDNPELLEEIKLKLYETLGLDGTEKTDSK